MSGRWGLEFCILSGRGDLHTTKIMKKSQSRHRDPGGPGSRSLTEYSTQYTYVYYI